MFTLLGAEPCPYSLEEGRAPNLLRGALAPLGGGGACMGIYVHSFMHEAVEESPSLTAWGSLLLVSPGPRPCPYSLRKSRVLIS